MNKESSSQASSSTRLAGKVATIGLLAAAFVVPGLLPVAMYAATCNADKQREEADDAKEEHDEAANKIADSWQGNRHEDESRLNVDFESSDGSGASYTYRTEDDE